MDVIKMDMDMDMGVMPGLMLALSKAETVRAGTYKIPIKGTDMVVTFQVKLDESDKGVKYATLAEGLVFASCKSNVYCAACLLYPGFLTLAAERLVR